MSESSRSAVPEQAWRYSQLYIDGSWVTPSSAKTAEVTDSASEQVVGSVPLGTAEDVDLAVSAAGRALPAWAATPAEERARYLRQVADKIEARTEELAEVITSETGMSARLSRLMQVGGPLASFRRAADVAADYEFEYELGTSLIIREPVGVVACITPWNYPLHQVAAKVAYALAAGCTVIVKPSEVAPLDTFILFEIFNEVGLPAGVANLVSGLGPEVGEALAGHPGVDMVSFTGSTRAGKRVAELAANSVKRVALELGGKSANILLDDMDEKLFAKAVKNGINRAFMNSGQTCSAPTRMLVPRSRLEEAEKVAAAHVSSMVVGDPNQENVHLGPLASAVQRDRVRDYINDGISAGAKLVAGGPDAPDDLPTGYYIRPTVFSDVDPKTRIAQEEIFGPVLAMIAYETADEAVEIANGVVYGLSGSVWASDTEKAKDVARRLRTGQVDLNGARINPEAPFGGYKQSGLGREHGTFGFEEFLEIKSVQL